ncbi:hypothetical protein [Asticcacaulis sp. AND118]|uniref:hypothetical protein n=1 Tax=Asticcacaulis sp. AND118 TaxID=2840468 RepID=UPI001CFF7053|nr:hypothetical protein [Asticcacaulis sp. AND118]UDF04641.1 hypothetical protein LH365_06270 [Asticcacaulis sp. AND118]
MYLLIAQSAALLLAVFLFSGFVGWHLSPRPKRAVRRISIFDEAPAPLVDSTLDAPLSTPAVETRPVADPMVAAAQTLNASRQAVQAPTALQAEFVAPRPSAEIIPLRPVAPPVVAAPAAPQPAPVGVSTELEPAIMAGIERPESMVAESSAEAPVEAPVVAAPQVEPVIELPVIELVDRTSRPKASLLSSMTPESVRAAVEQAGTGLEPHRLARPEGMPDDLTLISGIGGDNERELNMLGIYHYWQVASWTPEHVAWLSARVHAAPRIVRENWMAQAARLAGRAA